MNQDSAFSVSNRHCEFCEKLSTSVQYYFVGEARGVYFTYHADTHDKANKTFQLYSGQIVKYDLLSRDRFAYIFRPLWLPHIFCSSKCAAELSLGWEMWVDFETILDKVSVDFSKVPCPGENYPWCAQIVLPMDQFEYEVKICHVCKSQFPFRDKKYTISPIKTSSYFRGDVSSFLKPAGTDIVQTTTHKYRSEGHFWSITISRHAASSMHFCSDQCAYEYAKDNNAVVSFPNMIRDGCFTAVTPFTVALNEYWGRDYPYYPQKLMRLKY